jgi:carbon monoxide dehydrogenase subunit G
MLMTIAIVFAVLFIGLLLYATTRPSYLEIQRSKSIKAPPEKIVAFINDFHRWTAWSPYEGRDPAMKRAYSGAASGKGAVFEWDGNNNVGKGRMEITDIALPSRVTIKLDFDRPFKGHNIAEFTLAPTGDATTVTWAMRGASAFPMKVMGIFVNMNKMLGKDFEAGLANLKTASEQ